jgi:amidophosphoribosyltransferase
MCGIVGLLVKNPELRDRLGELMVPMLLGMTDRGPDSAGLAVFSEPVAFPAHKLSLYVPPMPGENVEETSYDWSELSDALRLGVPHDHHMTRVASHAILTTVADPEVVVGWLREHAPRVSVLSIGRSIDLYKDIGSPAAIANRYSFNTLRGTHVVAHTRMATESAVTPAHAHPFTAGHDFCLVHNGSLSNPHLVRRKLEPLGIHFDTDNDTEAACRFFEWRMREGDDLVAAVQRGFEELDGFYTFLMGTDQQLLIVRDAFSCKPAMIAETDDYVAIASEFRSLAELPGIRHASVFEPKPQQVYSWRV